MNEEKARELLKEYIQPNNDLMPRGEEFTRWYTDEENPIIDGCFSPDELEAIAWWVRNKKEKL